MLSDIRRVRAYVLHINSHKNTGFEMKIKLNNPPFKIIIRFRWLKTIRRNKKASYSARVEINYIL